MSPSFISPTQTSLWLLLNSSPNGSGRASTPGFISLGGLTPRWQDLISGPCREVPGSPGSWLSALAPSPRAAPHAQTRTQTHAASAVSRAGATPAFSEPQRPLSSETNHCSTVPGQGAARNAAATELVDKQTHQHEKQQYQHEKQQHQHEKQQHQHEKHQQKEQQKEVLARVSLQGSADGGNGLTAGELLDAQVAEARRSRGDRTLPLQRAAAEPLQQQQPLLSPHTDTRTDAQGRVCAVSEALDDVVPAAALAVRSAAGPRRAVIRVSCAPPSPPPYALRALPQYLLSPTRDVTARPRQSQTFG